jgi:hypothetical protein
MLLVCALAGCSTPPSGLSHTCAPGQQLHVSETLYFGTAKPDGVVSAQEWEAFLGDVVTPRFPDGLTVWNATGQWRSADDGEIVREQTYVLNLIHDGGTSSAAKVEELRDDYKRRFRQQAVLDTRAIVCTAF